MLEILNSEFSSSISLLQYHSPLSTHHSHSLICLLKIFHKRLLPFHILVKLLLSFYNAYHCFKIARRYRDLAHIALKSLNLSSFSKINSKSLCINVLYFQCKSITSLVFFQWIQTSKFKWFPMFMNFCFSFFRWPYRK